MTVIWPETPDPRPDPLLETEHSRNLVARLAGEVHEPIADALFMAEERGIHAALEVVGQVFGMAIDDIGRMHVGAAGHTVSADRDQVYRMIQRKLGRNP